MFSTVQLGRQAFLQNIPYKPEGSEPKVFNFVIEVPRWTNAKMEINLTEKLNPIFTRI
jgi:inorganic pyrophosphatase